jgi:transposase
MASKGQKFKKYDGSMKEMMVRRHLKDHASYAQLAQEYDIPEGTIITWVYQYRKNGVVPADKPGRSGPMAEADYKEKYEILKKFQAFCEKADRKRK